MKRREYLASATAAAALGLAGCGGAPETDGPAGDSGDDDGNAGGGEPSLAVEVDYDGAWQGAIATDSSTRTISGDGPETFDVDPSTSVLSANAQKQDDSSAKLTVRILEDGSVLKEASTTSAYGVAQVSATV